LMTRRSPQPKDSHRSCCFLHHPSIICTTNNYKFVMSDFLVDTVASAIQRSYSTYITVKWKI
jgi:hypothetical protein